MSCRRTLRKAVGVLLIVFGVAIFAMWEVMAYLYPPVDTDIESILTGEVPRSRTVRVRGTLSRSDWTVWEREEETGEFRGIRWVYDLMEESGGEELSIYVVSERRLEEGEGVVVEGQLHYNAYELRGYVVDVPEGPPVPMRWILACGMLVFALLGITLLVRR
jgi:hypothetical protein